jgi:hypothetical protein
MILTFLFWLTLIVQTTSAQTQTPAPATPFQIPLADGSLATAQFLPTHDGQGWLVYATSSGKLATYYLTPTAPGPTPVPPVPPVPVPTQLTIAIVEDPAATSPDARKVLADPTWRKLATEKHDFLGIIPSDIVDKKTGQQPPRLVAFLDRAKLHNLPWIMFTDSAGKILWEGQVPTTAAELLNLIHQYGG